MRLRCEHTSLCFRESSAPDPLTRHAICIRAMWSSAYPNTPLIPPFSFCIYPVVWACERGPTTGVSHRSYSSLSWRYRVVTKCYPFRPHVQNVVSDLPWVSLRVFYFWYSVCPYFAATLFSNAICIFQRYLCCTHRCTSKISTLISSAKKSHGANMDLEEILLVAPTVP